MTTTIAALMMTSLLLSSTGWGAVVPSSTPGTPIKHVVVIFQENVSYDHYFATYPNAANPSGEPIFHGKANTPSANGLTPALILYNPNKVAPFRLDRTQFSTCDQDHDYKPEQQAFHKGLMDMFVQSVGSTGTGCNPDGSTVMGYYDGNTVTSLWMYAQHFAMSDNSYGTTFGPSTPGMLNLIAGETHGATPTNIADTVVNGTIIGDPDGGYDDCSGSTKVNMTGTNIGDLLNSNHLTWGWFQGGFKPTVPWNATAHTKAVCGSNHMNLAGSVVTDYSAHHEPFEYYASTSNTHHLPPTSVAMIGSTDQANHQYDISDFWSAANSGKMPAVSFLKAAKYQDGHAGYSGPLDEQPFLVNTINKLQKLPTWNSTAVIIAYDDSDGWYDHVMPPIVNHSSDPLQDIACGTTKVGAFQDRCGYGPRLPLLVISPYAKQNFIDHSVTDQASILKFIEDNWGLGLLPDSQSFDRRAGSLNNMFDFAHGNFTNKIILNNVTGL